MELTTIDQVIAEKIGSLMIGEWPIGNLLLCLIALVLCVVLCGAVGIERESRGRSAGLRTHLLVGVGSCIIMIISIYGFPAGLQRDVARLAAQVVAGVGFLGAGAIIHRNAGTKGLTTAATVWITMAIGLACGSMNFILATIGTVLIIFVLVAFRGIKNRIVGKSPMIMVRAKANTPVIYVVLEVSKKFHCHVQDLHVELVEDDCVEATFMAVSNGNALPANEFLAALEKAEGVTQVSILHGGQD